MNGAEAIAAERQRQIDEEGYDPADDLRYPSGQLACAAATYALPGDRRTYRAVGMSGNTGDRGDAFRWVPRWWPWAWDAYKPTPDDRVRELVKAGALIAAEIDRLAAADAEVSA